MNPETIMRPGISIVSCTRLDVDNRRNPIVERRLRGTGLPCGGYQ